MPKAPAAIASPKIKKLAQKALKAPTMMSTAEMRELGASVTAHLSPSTEALPQPAPKKSFAKKAPTKRS